MQHLVIGESSGGTCVIASEPKASEAISSTETEIASAGYASLAMTGFRRAGLVIGELTGVMCRDGDI